MTRARELSKLANPEVFSVDSSNNVGINSLTPDSKLDVVGVVSATSFSGDGSQLTGIIAGATLSASNGTQRVVVTSQTTGSMTEAATNSDITYDTGSSTLSATKFSGTFLGNATGLSGTPDITVGIATATEYNGRLGNYSETVNVLGNTGATPNINIVSGNFVTAILNQNATFTFTSPGTSGKLFSFGLQLTNGSGGPFTITWPTTVKWPGGVVPARTTTDARSDVYSFYTTDNGTNWYGAISQYDYN